MINYLVKIRKRKVLKKKEIVVECVSIRFVKGQAKMEEIEKKEELNWTR